MQLRLSLAAATLALVLLAPPSARADEGVEPPPTPTANARSFQTRRATLMYVLSGWSAASVATGLPLALASSTPFPRQVGIQFAVWGAVDGAIAIYSLVSASSEDLTLTSDADAAKASASLHKIFWINALLDVAYVATGSALLAFGKNDTVRGVGAGVLVQGGFLLAFDSTGAWVMAPR